MRQLFMASDNFFWTSVVKGDAAKQDTNIFETKWSDRYGWKEEWECKEWLDLSRSKEKPASAAVRQILTMLKNRISMDIGASGN